MKKGFKAVTAAALAVSALTPVAAFAAESTVDNGVYTSTNYYSIDAFKKLSGSAKASALTSEGAVIVIAGKVYSGNNVITLSDSKLDASAVTVDAYNAANGNKLVSGKPLGGENQTVDLKVESVSAINAKQLVVKFSKAVDKNSVVTTSGSSTTLNANIVSVEKTSTDVVSNQVGNGTLAGNAASLSEDGKELTITLSGNNIFAGSYDVIVKNATSSEVKMPNYYGSATIKDTVAPTVTKAEYVTTSGKIRVTLSEPITSVGFGKAVLIIDGKPYAFDAPSSYPATSLTVSVPAGIELGSTVTVNVAGIEDAAGNLLTPYTGQVTLTKDASALSVTGFEQISNQKVRVTLNKKLDTASNAKILTSAPNNGLVITKDDGTVTTNYTVAAAPSAVNANGNVYDITFADATYATSNDFAVSVSFTKDAFTDVTGNKNALETKTLTLKKDITAPTVVSSKVNVAGDKIELTFSEEVNPSSIDNSKLFLRLDGGELQAGGPTVSAAIKANTDNKVVEISLSGSAASTAIVNGKLKAGSYQVRLTEGFIKDINGVDVKTTNAPLVTVAGSVQEALTATVASTPASNVITIAAPAGEKFATSSLTNGKFFINGTQISSDADIKFTSTANTTISITLPTSESVKYTGASSFSATGVTLDSAKPLNAPYGTVTLADNSAPVLQSARLIDNKTIELTYDEAIGTLSSAQVGDEFIIKQGGTTLTLAAAEITAGNVAGFDNKVLLTVAKNNTTTTAATAPITGTNASKVAAGALTSATTTTAVNYKVVSTPVVATAPITGTNASKVAAGALTSATTTTAVNYKVVNNSGTLELQNADTNAPVVADLAAASNQFTQGGVTFTITGAADGDVFTVATTAATTKLELQNADTNAPVVADLAAASNQFTQGGVTFTITGAVAGDLFTVATNAATSTTTAQTLDLTKDITVTTFKNASSTLDIKDKVVSPALTANAQKVNVTVNVAK
ncbi:Ig-like domain-containing protein [Lysinibacillus sp. FSL K6-0057]|uniref:Ig-like domain-containing protein n=1 Tax=Lysinibacillus sp. FSL K6-0057 TaxID=2921411 RepID=UPI00315A4876